MSNTIEINAASLGYSDLDEYLPCKNIQNELLKLSENKTINFIEINLEKCWLDYAFSSLYLDEALRILIGSKTECRKTLKIIVSVDLGEPHFMIALLFSLSTIIKSEMDSGTPALLDEAKRVAKTNNLDIVILSKIIGNKNQQSEKYYFIGENKDKVEASNE